MSFFLLGLYVSAWSQLKLLSLLLNHQVPLSTKTQVPKFSDYVYWLPYIHSTIQQHLSLWQLNSANRWYSVLHYIYVCTKFWLSPQYNSKAIHSLHFHPLIYQFYLSTTQEWDSYRICPGSHPSATHLPSNALSARSYTICLKFASFYWHLTSLDSRNWHLSTWSILTQQMAAGLPSWNVQIG